MYVGSSYFIVSFHFTIFAYLVSRLRPFRGRSEAIIRFTGLAFAAYWGIIIFGYDAHVATPPTGDRLLAYRTNAHMFSFFHFPSGAAGSVVTQTYFETQFGILKDGKINTSEVDNISLNVVSVLQAGAFFDALGSAWFSGKFGRKWSLIGFMVIFVRVSAFRFVIQIFC